MKDFLIFYMVLLLCQLFPYKLYFTIQKNNEQNYQSKMNSKADKN